MSEINHHAKIGELIARGIPIERKINDFMYFDYHESFTGSNRVDVMYRIPLTNEFMSQFTTPEKELAFSNEFGSWEITPKLRFHLQDYFTQTVMTAYGYEASDLSKIQLSIMTIPFSSVSTKRKDIIVNAVAVIFTLDVSNFLQQSYNDILRVFSPVTSQWEHFDKNKVEILQRLLENNSK